MPAPEISSFGDGSHPPGASGLAVDGGGFGAFPGSVWIYENDDLTGDADQLDIVAWNDLQISIDIPASLSNAAGTRYLFVQREDLAWSNPFEFELELVASPIGQVLEQGSVQPMGRSKSFVIGRVSEMSSAQAFASLKRRAIGQAGEDCSAQPLGVGSSLPILQVVESAQAISVSRRKSRIIGVSADVNSAQQMLAGKTRAIAGVLVQESAFSFSSALGYVIGAAAEAAHAHPFAASKLRAIAGTGEIDSAGTVSFVASFSTVVNSSQRLPYSVLNSDQELR